jgi:hypothetical protein
MGQQELCVFLLEEERRYKVQIQYVPGN